MDTLGLMTLVAGALIGIGLGLLVVAVMFYFWGVADENDERNEVRRWETEVEPDTGGGDERRVESLRVRSEEIRSR